MLGQSFESIVSGQLPPDQWYDLGLDDRFGHLEPGSDTARMALCVEIDWVDIVSKIAENGDGLEFEGESRVASSEDFYIKLEVHNIFGNIYDFMTRALSGGLASSSGAEIKMSYQEALDTILRLQTDTINKLTYLPETARETLCRTAKSLCALYAMEEGEHFKGLGAD